MLATSGFLFTTHPDGASLPVFYQVILLVHIAGGLSILLPMVAFVLWHLRRALKMRNRNATVSGLLLTLLAVALAVSGLTITTEANSVAFRWVFRTHQIGAAVLVVLFVGHRLVSRRKPTRRALAAGIAAPVLLYGGLVAGLAATRGQAARYEALDAVSPLGPMAASGKDPFVPFRPATEVAANSPFHPAAATTASGARPSAVAVTAGEVEGAETFAEDLLRLGFAARQRVGAASCARCHADTVEQWASSAHRFSSLNNPFYEVPIDDLRNRSGKERSQWCGSCHDPALLFPGSMAGEIDKSSPEAHAGITCLTCHLVDRIHNLAGNGNYELRDTDVSPYLFHDADTEAGEFLFDRLVRSKPDVHKRRMLQPFYRSSEYCATCHKVSLDVAVNGYRWLRGQNEYDAWQDSGVSRANPRTFYLPEEVRTCQDCHMPREAAPLGDVSAKGGTVRSHRFVGANTALPYVRGDAEMQRLTEAFMSEEKLRVDVFAVVRESGEAVLALDRTRPRLAAGERVVFEVVVRNLGVGHSFPGGTTDSNEAWIDFSVTGDGGRELFRSGAVRKDRHVDPGAHFYRAVFIDEKGERANRRNPQDFRTLVYANVIGPGTADLARYEVVLPADLEGGAVTVRAVVRWRKFNREYTEYVYRTLGRPVPELPITDLVAGEVTLHVGGENVAPVGPADADWVRFNDHGIALFRQGDTARAAASFAEVAVLAAERPDGPRNLARIALREGDVPLALERLREAETLSPGDPQNAFFFGRAFRAAGRFDKAEEAFRACRSAFPRDRGTLKEIGTIRYQDGDFEGALEVFIEVLRIDPEDLDAHFHRMKCYEGLGRREDAASARGAYLKYKADDNAAKRARRYLAENEAMNREAQRIHVHR